MKKSNILVIILCIIVSSIMYFTRDSSDTRPYTAFSTGELGTALFYDSLNLMGYPVRIGRRALTTNTNINDIYIIIEPTKPIVNTEMAKEMLEWVQMGGRLIFMQNAHSMSNFESLLFGGQSKGNITIYNIGLGEVVTIRTRYIQNRGLFDDPSGAVHILSILDEWDGNIFFAEYYHGYGIEETFFTQLPLVVRLSVIHLFIIAIAIILCVGKRFGKAVPVYQEIERTENEQVKALATLLMKTKE